MKKVKVTAANLDRLEDGILIRVYEKLDEVSHKDERIDQVIKFQTKISQQLEKRGWTYNEADGEWVYSL